MKNLMCVALICLLCFALQAQGQSYYMILTQEWGGAYDGYVLCENQTKSIFMHGSQRLVFKFFIKIYYNTYINKINRQADPENWKVGN